MAKPFRKSALLATSLASDWQVSNGIISVTGLSRVNKKTLISIKQIKSRPEVVQVITVGGAAYTPTANTPYRVAIWDPNRRSAGYQETPKIYSFQLASITGVAATDREAISVGLCAAINADNNNRSIATTSGGGNGFTVTDDGLYYPVRSQTMTNVQGANSVYTITNSDGSGFTATNFVTTTAAVTSFGIGAILLQQKVVVDLNFGGNLISGDLDDQAITVAGAAAISGQNYDGFEIISLLRESVPTLTDIYAYIEADQIIYVDNGTGTSTTNLAGFVAFEKEALRSLGSNYENDPMAIVEFFDNPLSASATYPTTGALITTTDNVVMEVNTGKNIFYVNPIGTHTLLTPVVTASGLQPFLDVTTQEGVEIGPCNLTQCPKEAVVGKTEFSLYARVNIGSGIATTDFKTFSFGLRNKKLTAGAAVYAVDQTAYEAASVSTVAIGVPLDTGAAPVWNMITGPGSAGALTNTSTAVTPAVSTAHDFLITVDIAGVVRFYVNGVDKTPLLAATYTFAAGTHVMPFTSFRHGANVGAVPLVLQTMFLPTITWRG